MAAEGMRVSPRTTLRSVRTPDDSKLPEIRMYDLRHTHITLNIAAGVNLKIVAERVGHASIRLTADTYAAVLPTMQKEAVAQLDRFMAGGA